MENNILKIKEECLKIQEKDISDQVKNIDNENNKSWIIIWFVWTIITFWLQDFNNKGFCLLIIFFTLSIIPILLALMNIWSKSVWYHLNINTFFINESNDYKKYLNDMHLAYQNTYKNVSDLLVKKALLTKLSYIFTIILLIFILFIKLFKNV